MKRIRFSSLMLVIGLLFIYLPMLILVIYSFNASKLVTVWGGWSIKWYVGLLDNTQLMGSVLRSLEIACYTAIAAVALGTLAAFVLTRVTRFRASTRAIEPPPAPISTISITGMRTGRPLPFMKR